MRCDECKRTLDELKAAGLPGIIWTSHYSNRKLCSSCMLDELEAHGIEPPDNSLQAINGRRKKQEKRT